MKTGALIASVLLFSVIGLAAASSASHDPTGSPDFSAQTGHVAFATAGKTVGVKSKPATAAPKRTPPKPKSTPAKKPPVKPPVKKTPAPNTGPVKPPVKKTPAPNTGPVKPPAKGKTG